MSVHKNCGEQIRWAQRPGGGWFPPLELVGEVFILTRNEGGDGDYTGSEVMAYRIHQCDPDKMEAWQAYKERLASIEDAKVKDERAAYVSDREAARARDMENAWDEVHGTPCPRSEHCLTDGYCCNLTAVKKNGGEFVPTKWPHPERVLAAQQAKGVMPI